MRPIDADALMRKLEPIIEAENQIYRRESWGFAVKCRNEVEEASTIEPEQRWIPSGEKPPKEGNYLVWMPFAPPKHRMAVAEYCGGYWNIKTQISAWMPLPEPWEGDRRSDDKTNKSSSC